MNIEVLTEVKQLIAGLNGSQQNPEQCQDFLEQLKQRLTNLQDHSYTNQVLETVLSEANGILGFLRKNVGVLAFDPSKVLAFSILSKILADKSIDSSLVTPYILKFKNIINFAWRKGSAKSASVRNAALDCLIVLLENYGSLFTAYDLEAANLYQELLTSSESSDYERSTRGKIFYVIGLLVFKYRDGVLRGRNLQIQLLRHIVGMIRKNVERKNATPDYTILEGAVRAVDYFLRVYGDEFDGQLDELYNHLEILANPQISIAHDQNSSSRKVTRREFQRATLTCIANNGRLFKQKLYVKHKQWFKDLLTWYRSANAEDALVAKTSMLSFLRLISSCLAEAPVNEEAIQKRDSLISYFSNEFLLLLDSQDSSKADLTISIQGIGVISTVSMDSDRREKLISRVFLQVENIMSELKTSQSAKTKYTIYHMLHIYMDCVAQLLLCMAIPDDAALKKFQVRLLLTRQLCGIYLKYYPRLLKKYKHEGGLSFLSVIRSVYLKHHTHLHAFIDSLLNEGLTQMIAAPMKTEVFDVTNYVSNQPSEPDGENAIDKEKSDSYLPAPVTNYFQCWIFLIKSSLEEGFPVSISSLLYDVCIQWFLSTVKKLDLTLLTNDEGSEADDHAVEVADPVYNMRANVPKDFNLLVNAVDFFQAFVLQTNSTLLLKWIPSFVSEMSAYVQTCPFVSGFYRVMATVFSVMKDVSYFKSEANVENNTVGLCQRFMESSGVKVKEFRDDLLICVLEVWLAAPVELIINVLPKLEHVLCCVFSLGQTHLNFAHRGVDALERWFESDDIPIIEKEKLFCDLFPVLMNYFSSSVDSETENGQSIMPDGPDVRGTLSGLQSRLLRFIGSFGHFYKVKETRENPDGPLMSLEDKLLKYSIPFQDIKPDLHLDNLLPRIFELCSNATDRQVRTSACECLHTMTLYFLGHSTNSLTGGKNEELFRKLFSQVLKLGCDAAVLVHQIFNPLAIQIVHYCISKTENYDSALLEIIVDGLTQTESSSLRDFSSVCIGEYFTWTLKTQDINHGKKMGLVMKTVCALSTHSATNYRQGSVLAFNSIYRDFRENDNLVNEFTLLLMHSFLVSLCLPSEFDSDSVLIQSTKQALKHLERIILKKKDFFNIALRNRRYPADLTGSCMKDLVEWIFKKVGECRTTWGRDECLRLLVSFSPSIKGIGSIKALIESLETNFGLEWIERTVEKSIANLDLEPSRTMENREGVVESLCVAVDFYSFLIMHDSILVERLLNGKGSIFVPMLENVLLRFSYDKLPTIFLLKAGRIIASPALTNLFTAEVKSTFFISSIRESARAKESKCLLDLVQTWDALCIDDSCRQECRSLVCGLVTFPDSEVTVEGRQIRTKDAMRCKEIFDWLRAVHSASFLRKIVTIGFIEELIQKSLTFVDQHMYYTGKNGNLEYQLLPLHIEKLLQGIMSLVFDLGWGGDGRFLANVFNTEEVIYVDGKLEEKMAKGDIFQNLMMPSLLNYKGVFDFQQMVTRVKLEKIVMFITKLIETVKQSKDYRLRYAEALVNGVTSVWQPLQLNFDSVIVSSLLSGMINLTPGLVRNSKELCLWWMETMTSSQKIVQEKSSFLDFMFFFGLSASVENREMTFKAIQTLCQLDWKKSDDSNQWLMKVYEAVLSLCEKFPANTNLLNSLSTMFLKIVSLSEQEHALSEDECSPTCHHYACFAKIQTIYENIGKQAPGAEGVAAAENIYTLIRTGDPVCSLFLQKFCLIPCLLNLTKRDAKSFFMKHIGYIVDSVGIETNTQADWISKTAALSLIQTLTKMFGEEFRWPGSELNEEYLRQRQNVPRKNGKELVRAIMNFWLKTKGKDFKPDETNTRTRSVQFSCIAAEYNSVAAILLATDPGKEDLFTIFLFKKKSGATSVWDKIIDSKAEFTFPVVKEFRSEVYAENYSAKTSKLAPDFFAISRLEESSLAVEACQYDFTHVGVNNAGHIDNTSDCAGFVEAKFTGPRRTVSLSDNILNKHQCMETLVQVVSSLGVHHVDIEGIGTMPSWMDEIFQEISRATSKPNVKVFLTGFILNCAKIFKSFALKFLEPIIKVMIDGHCRNHKHESTTSLNSFEKELILMLLDWKENARPSSEVANKLFKYCMSKVYHYTRKDVYKQNLSFLTEMAKSWIKTTFTSSVHDEILKLLDAKAPDPKIGLNIVNHILQGGVLPCTEENLNTFIETVSKFLDNKVKGVYELTAETLGILLKCCSELEVSGLAKKKSLIRKFITPQKGRIQPFIVILNAIALNFSPLVASYKGEILSLLKHKPEVRREAMGLVLIILKGELAEMDNSNKKTTVISSMLSDLEGRGIFRKECSDEEECQTGVEFLSIFLESDSANDLSKLSELLNWINKAEYSLDAKLRLKYASSLSKGYTILSASNSSNSALLQKIFLTFTRMHADEDNEVSACVDDFWARNLSNWVRSPYLLLELIEKFSEDSRCVIVMLDLLIKRCSRSPDFGKLLFDTPLSELEYKVYNPDTTWNIQKSTLQPLFVDSSSQHYSTLAGGAISSAVSQQRGATQQRSMNFLRSTLRMDERKFSLTQPENSLEAEDAMDMGNICNIPIVRDIPVGSLNEPSPANFQNPLSSLRQSFYSGSSGTKVEVFRKPGPRKGSSRFPGPRGAKNVKLTRSYRIGELPDILIKNSELLQSIGSLAKGSEVKEQFTILNSKIINIEISNIKHAIRHLFTEIPNATFYVVWVSVFKSFLSRFMLGFSALEIRHVDDEFSKVFLIHLFVGIVNEMQGGTEREKFVTEIRSTFDVVLKKGPSLSRRVVSTILEVSTMCDIFLPSHLVSESSKNWKLAKSGIIKLEQDLNLDTTPTTETPSKRPRYSTDLFESSKADAWLRSAQLYREINDLDSLRIIFSHVASGAANATEEAYYAKATEAIHNDSVGNYVEALFRYDSLYVEENKKQDASCLKLQIWNDGVQRAFINICKWDECYKRSCKLSDEVTRMEGEFQNLAESIMSQRLISGVQTLLRSTPVAELKQKATELKEDFLSDGNWEHVLESRPILMALISFLQGNSDDCNFILVRNANSFNKEFQHFEQLTPSEKENLVCDVRRVTALFDVLDVSKNLSMPCSEFTTMKKTGRFLRKWKQLTSTGNTSLKNADIIVTERNFFLNNLLQSLPAQLVGEVSQEFVELKFFQDLWVSQVAARYRNSYVGNEYLNFARKLGLEQHVMNWRKSFSNLIVSSDLATYSEFDWIKHWVACWKKLLRTNHVEAMEIQCELLQNLLSTCCSRELQRDTMAKLSEIIPVTSNRDMIGVTSNWINSVTSSYFHTKSSNYSEILLNGEASMKLFRLMKTVESKFSSEFSGTEKFHRNMLLCLFNGLKLNNPDASKHFPVCFQIIEAFPKLGHLLPEMASEVSGWLLLPWLDQIMANHAQKSCMKPLLEPLIRKLYTEYPNAFQLQYTKINDIPNLLSVPLLESYEKALLALALPQTLFAKEIAVKFQTQIPNFREFLVEFVRKLEMIISQPEFYGELHQIFANEIYTEMKAHVDSYANYEVPMEDRQNLLNKIFVLIRSAGNLMRKRGAEKEDKSFKSFQNLKDFSPWLSKFHFSNYKDSLQVPGLEFNFEKPPDEFLKPQIVSFDPLVYVYKSLTNPIRFSLLANDGKKYSFIAKRGDDLRQDKRIQQLFKFSNSVLNKTPECWKRNLRIMTYAVIPVNADFGLIQWITKTRSLTQFIFKTDALMKKWNESLYLYGRWINPKEISASNFQVYGQVAMREHRLVETEYEKVVKAIQSDLFLQNVRATVDTSEKYFVLRERLVRSLATMSYVNWILGIGDRHLENTMISLETGEFLGIDFGYAFSQSLIRLDVPELAPFRLTPQLQQLLKPYGKNGMFKEVMGYTMRALSQASQFLLSAAEVFVTEPLANWNRSKAKVEGDTMAGKEDAKQQIAVLEDKLKGGNPIKILERLLQLLPNPQFAPHWSRVIHENHEKLGKKINLSQDESLELLISLATDPNILGRAYLGWGSWV